MSNIEDPFPVPKSESFKEESTSESSPELEEQNLTREPSQVVKKKRGRKPVYKLPIPTHVNQLTRVQIKISSEERKERNREAQVAFRRWKADYRKKSETIIKQLKETLQSSQQSHRSAAAIKKQLEETLQSSQQSHRSAADECLMFRYKNSLLERILLDKGLLSELRSELGIAYNASGIDVQAELELYRIRRSQSTLESGSQTQRPSSSQAPSNNFTQIQQISPRVAQQQRQSPPPQGVSCVFPSTSPSNATATDGGRSSEHSNPSYKLHLEQLGKLKPLSPAPFPFRFPVRLRLIS